MSLVHFAVLALTGFEAAHTMTWTSGELTPWPMPASVSNGTDSLRVSAADVEITTECPSQILERAIQRYKTVIAQGSPPTPVPDAAVVRSRAATKVALSVSVEDASEELGDETDESYKLDFLADGSAQVSAKTVFGALKGLESFSQLFETTSDGDLLVRGLPWSVSDSPRFAHRGMLIDSSRHFLELDTIRNHVDSMAMSKLNVLHWHLVDFQSFPFNSSAAPRLVLGAFSPRESYSPDDVRGIVTYAKDRGVRVVIEVDTPGHSQSWGRGYPDVITSCPKTIAAKGGGYAIMDPTVNATYDVLSKVLSELGSIATDPVFHLGGDEVRKDCWSESASIRAFMEQKGFGTDFSLLENYYEQRLLEVAAKAMPNRTLMVYQEVFDNNISLPGRVIFDVWRSHNAAPIPDEVAAIVRSGHRVVVSNGNQGNWVRHAPPSPPPPRISPIPSPLSHLTFCVALHTKTLVSQLGVG